MSNLTDAGLEQLHAAVIARLKEFEMPNLMLPTLGVVRLVVDVYAEADWWQESRATIPVPDDEPPPPTIHPYAAELIRETAKLPHLPERVISSAAVATLGPEHVVVTPLQNGKPRTLAEVDGTASDEWPEGDGDYTRGKYQPTQVEIIAVLKQMAMGGVAPSQATFDDAKPATWGTAVAQTKRLGMTWSELALEAGLTPRNPGR